MIVCNEDEFFRDVIIILGDVLIMIVDEYGLKGEKEDLIMLSEEDLVLEKVIEVFDKGKLLWGFLFVDVMLVIVFVKDDFVDDFLVVKE